MPDVRITIDLVSQDPLCGSALVDGAPPVDFAGWLQLLTLLDRWTNDSAPSGHLGGQLGPIGDPELHEDM